MRNYVTECIGTFFLVLTIGLTSASGTPLAPLAIGAARSRWRPCRAFRARHVTE